MTNLGFVLRLAPTLLFIGCGATGASPAPPVEMSDGSAMGPENVDGGIDEGSDGCPIRQTAAVAARAAKSAGFTGTDPAYYALYDVACQSLEDCSASCVAAGGSDPSCRAASECPDDLAGGRRTCLPPTYWLNAEGALSQSGTTMNAATLILVDLDYHDPLVLTDFGVQIPDNATIRGIQFKVRRNADTGAATDGAVRILKNDAEVGLDRAGSGPWPTTLSWVTFGDASDTWGESWTPADIRASGFGVSIASRYDAMAGNDRAHIDSVRATVFYTTPCN